MSCNELSYSRRR